MKILLSGKKCSMVFAFTLCAIFAVGVQRAEANPVKGLWEMLFESLDAISESLDNVYVDTWRGRFDDGDYDQTVSRGWVRTVPAMEDKYFELNASIACSFTANGSDINTARISFRRSDDDPYLVSLEAQSTEQTVELNTGPVVGYQSSPSRQYVVQCLPTGSSTFFQAVTTVKFEALPDPDTGNSMCCD